MLDVFKIQLEIKFPEVFSKKTLLAVSGGIDSMVLLDLFYKLNLPFEVAHCNFQLRNEESFHDEMFVRDYCLNKNIICHVKHFETENYALENRKSIQIAARELRYAWFDELLEQQTCDFLATAHHLDDQVETFLIHFTRGTGIDGLLGIPEVNNRIIRPLLTFSRDDIHNYALQNLIQWREDATNQTTKYLRNKIRHLVVPILKEENTAFLDSFKNTLDYLKQTRFLAEKALEHFESRCISNQDEYIVIDLNRAADYQEYLIYLSTYLKKFGFNNFVEIQKLVHATSGKLLKNDKFTLLKNRNEFIIKENIIKYNCEYIINSTKDLINAPILLSFSEVSCVEAVSDKNTIFVDTNLLKFPLVLRKPQLGETFVPIGMRGRKKISKFFKDEKFSMFQKETAWVLVNADEQVVWVVGHRADDRFKVTENTNKVYKISLAQ